MSVKKVCRGFKVAQAVAWARTSTDAMASRSRWCGLSVQFLVPLRGTQAPACLFWRPGTHLHVATGDKLV
eukprot:gene18133-biopygen5255